MSLKYEPASEPLHMTSAMALRLSTSADCERSEDPVD